MAFTLEVPRINRNNEVENTGYMLNEFLTDRCYDSIRNNVYISYHYVDRNGLSCN